MDRTERTDQIGNIQFGAYDPDLELSPELWTYGIKLYIWAWGLYKEAGCPLGESDEAMLVWFTFEQEQQEQMGKNDPVTWEN